MLMRPALAPPLSRHGTGSTEPRQLKSRKSNTAGQRQRSRPELNSPSWSWCIKVDSSPGPSDGPAICLSPGEIPQPSPQPGPGSGANSSRPGRGGTSGSKSTAPHCSRVFTEGLAPARLPFADQTKLRAKLIMKSPWRGRWVDSLIHPAALVELGVRPALVALLFSLGCSIGDLPWTPGPGPGRVPAVPALAGRRVARNEGSRWP